MTTATCFSLGCCSSSRGGSFFYLLLVLPSSVSNAYLRFGACFLGGSSSSSSFFCFFSSAFCCFSLFYSSFRSLRNRASMLRLTYSLRPSGLLPFAARQRGGQLLASSSAAGGSFPSFSSARDPAFLLIPSVLPLLLLLFSNHFRTVSFSLLNFPSSSKNTSFGFFGGVGDFTAVANVWLVYF